MSKELAVIESDDHGIIGVMQYLSVYKNTENKLEIASFDQTSEAGMEKLVLGTLEELPALSDLANLQIEVSDFLMHEASRVEDNGELKIWQRIVIYTPDGKAWDCGSMGVKKCIEIMLRVRKEKLFNPPVLCTVKVDKIDPPKIWMTLRPDMDSLFCRKPTKRK